MVLTLTFSDASLLQNTPLATFCAPFHMFVTVGDIESSNLAHELSIGTNNLYMGLGRCHVTHFKF